MRVTLGTVQDGGGDTAGSAKGEVSVTGGSTLLIYGVAPPSRLSGTNMAESQGFLGMGLREDFHFFEARVIPADWGLPGKEKGAFPPPPFPLVPHADDGHLVQQDVAAVPTAWVVFAFGDDVEAMLVDQVEGVGREP